jgi:hypothetical protein
LAFNELHSFISEKIQFFITAVRTSNYTLTETEHTEKRIGRVRANFYKGASEEDAPSFL